MIAIPLGEQIASVSLAGRNSEESEVDVSLQGELVHIVCLYGYVEPSRCREDAEALFEAVVAMVSRRSRMPAFIVGDYNLELMESEFLAAAVSEDLLRDLQALQGQARRVTHLAGGVLDHLLANECGAQLVKTAYTEQQYRFPSHRLQSWTVNCRPSSALPFYRVVKPFPVQGGQAPLSLATCMDWSVCSTPKLRMTSLPMSVDGQQDGSTFSV